MDNVMTLMQAGGAVMWPLFALLVLVFVLVVERIVTFALATKHKEKLSEAKAYHVLSLLDLIASIAPVLGFLGTVTGMISTFSVLDNGAGASAVTGGVGEALVATATGLCVAILAFCVYTYFSHQLDTIVTDTEKVCMTVMQARKNA